MHITLAIPTYNRADSLRHTLRSLNILQLPAGVRADVLIVDNASSDHTQQAVVEASRESALPIRSVVETQPGLCYGRNRALQEPGGEHVVFLDDDIEIGPAWLAGYHRAVLEWQADCVVGPVVPVYPLPLPAYATPAVLSIIGSDYSRRGDVSFVLPPRVAHEIPGCNFGVRRDVALSLGGLNNSLDRVGSGLLAGGDTEFGMRLRDSKKMVVYEPLCTVNHLIAREKLERGYLRRRAAGLGRTAALLRYLHGRRRSGREWMQGGRRALGLWVRWQQRRALGPADKAFESELRSRWQWADLRYSLAGRAKATQPVLKTPR